MTSKTPSTESLATPIARYIWQTRYRCQQPGVNDQSIEDSWTRVSSAIAEVEGDDSALWRQRFYQILENFSFLPGGRILAGAGSQRRVTLFNCFAMGLIDDDMESIFEALKQGALTMQAGGGIGYDFSTLRPAGTRALASGGIASGPLSFMQVWDSMCETLLSTGIRRGAMMATLRCDHPDILAFIEAKREAQHLTHFNLSVQVTDDFMQAVDADEDWLLVFPCASLPEDRAGEIVQRAWPGYDRAVSCRVLSRIPARQLWQKLMRNSYDTGEPGVLFIDRINAWNNLSYREILSTTNPCGEIPLPPYGACNLGSINLTRFVDQPFTPQARINFKALAQTARIATRFLDNVIDVSWFPLPQQAKQARGSRRIGLGISGLADTLIMLGLHYAENPARELAARMMQTICHAAYRCSIMLAEEKGSFEFFEKSAYLASRFVQSLPADIRDGIARYGIRNSHLTAIAPTGTISLLANNLSSGIEPVFDFWQSRRILAENGEPQLFELQDFAIRLWTEHGHDLEHLPPEFVRAAELAPGAHIQMQAAIQPFVDNAISKTINIPEDYAYEDYQELYRQAYALGLKGCTTYRPNPVRGQVLSPGDQQPLDKVSAESGCAIDSACD